MVKLLVFEMDQGYHKNKKCGNAKNETATLMNLTISLINMKHPLHGVEDKINLQSLLSDSELLAISRGHRVSITTIYLYVFGHFISKGINNSDE